MTSLAPQAKFRAFDTNGNPLSGGKLYTYAAGTTTPLATTKDAAGTPNTNPIILDQYGQCDIWLSTASFKFLLKDSGDVTQPGWPVDNVQTLEGLIVSSTAGAIKTIATFADISAALSTLSIGQQFSLAGHTVAGVGGGIFDVVSSALLTADTGTIVINGAKAAKRRYDYLIPEYFGCIGDGIADDIAGLDYFNTALSMSVDGVMDGDYRITRTFKIKRGKKIRGCGSIIADFTTVGTWSADYCAIDMLIDSTDSSAAIFACFGQYLKGIKITSIAANTVQATALRFRTSLVIPVTSVVNFSYLTGSISGITIEKFDTALELREAWAVDYTDVVVYNCRRALYINGKSVNITFGTGCRFTNPDTAYTSSTADTIGVEIDSSTRYVASAQGRPEGIAITGGCLIYGYDNNIYANRVLALTVSGNVIDGAAKDSIILGSGDDVRITDNYIFSSGAYSGIRIDGVASAYGSRITIDKNHIIGSAPTHTCYGVNFVNTGVSRNSVKIRGNVFVDWTIGINAVLCPAYSVISDNSGSGLITDLIYIQNGGDSTEIAGNTTPDSVNALRLHPSTSSELIIGKNKSALNRTYFVGKATVLSGTSAISLPNNFRTTGDNYVRALTKVTFITAFPGTFNITDEFSLSDARLNLSSNALVDTIVRYECTAVPQSAF